LRSEGVAGAAPTVFTNIPDAHNYGGADDELSFPFVNA